MTKTLTGLGLIAMIICSFQTTKSISQNEAIQIAEKFIEQNGYTLIAPDKKYVQYGINDDIFIKKDGKRLRDEDFILAQRHNTLYKGAFYVTEGANDWYVGFVYTAIDTNNLNNLLGKIVGRVVTVSKSNADVHLKHLPSSFSQFERIK